MGSIAGEVSLLESNLRAFAKTYSTYEKIEIGYGVCAHRDLTGGPAVFYNVKENTPEEADRFFKIAENALKTKFVLSATTKASDKVVLRFDDRGLNLKMKWE